MKRLPRAMSLWTAALVVLIAGIALYYCASIMVNTKSLVTALFAALAIGITTFFALWALLGSVRGNQGKYEFNEMNLRLKAMAGVDEVPKSGKSGHSSRR